MNNKTGGPANPVFIVAGNANPRELALQLESMQTGLTLREPEAIADMSDAELKEFTSWDYHSLSSNEIKEPRVKAYVEAYEAYREAESARQEEWLKQRYIQWPVAWADAMLKARQQPQE